ncbi:MAG: GntR family transcriptional regulator [Terriglobales bacterium]
MSTQALREPPAAAQPGEPAYSRIKRYVLDHVGRGQWQEGDRVPSEGDLVRPFRVSRMTAHRALRDLTSEQVLRRAQGVGTFVAASKTATTLITVHGIQDETRDRGHQHTGDVLALQRIRLSEAGAPLALPPETMLFRSLLPHRETAS